MSELKNIKSALISVYHKDGLEEIVQKLNQSGVHFYSTGGTKDFIEGFWINAYKIRLLYISISDSYRVNSVFIQRPFKKWKYN